MKIKYLISITALMGIIFVADAHARPEYHTKDSAQSFKALSAEEQSKWMKLHEALIEDSRKLQNELQAKKMEYRALKNNPQVKPEYIRTLTERIVELEYNIEKMNKAFVEKSKKDFNLMFSFSGNSKDYNCPMMKHKHGASSGMNNPHHMGMENRGHMGHMNQNGHMGHKSPCMNGSKHNLPPNHPPVSGMGHGGQHKGQMGHGQPHMGHGGQHGNQMGHGQPQTEHGQHNNMHTQPNDTQAPNGAQVQPPVDTEAKSM